MSLTLMDSVFKTFIRNELTVIQDKAREAGIMVSRHDVVGNNDITMFVEANHPALAVQIRKGSEQFDMQKFIQDNEYKAFRVGKTLAVYLDESNFFYATLGKEAV